MAAIRVILGLVLVAGIGGVALAQAKPGTEADSGAASGDEPLPPDETALPGPPPRLDLPDPNATPKQAPAQSVMGRAMRLQRDVEQRLQQDRQLSERRIVVITDARGGVTLLGEVGTKAERQRAGRLADSAGATRVTNHLKASSVDGTQRVPSGREPSSSASSRGLEQARPRPAEREDPDQVITEKIVAALAAEPSTTRAAIEVETINGSVILRGTVPSEAARARAVDIARSTPGVTKVVEDLVVPPQL